ncbi:MAG: hypothetical protein A3G38_02930, partial [Omnitrophica WOR_2 bacterium RIFCSPLOWO2_12_FULL_51_8]
MKTIFKLIILAAIILAAIPMAQAFGKTINAATCSQSDVQNAINSAVTGDTVLVPAGNCTWGNQVTLPAGKDIILKGAGVGKTVITGAGWRALYIASGSRVTGFEIFQDTTYEEIIKVESPGHKRFRIDHCKLGGAPYGYALKMFYILGDASRGGQPFGVMDNCELTDIRINLIGSSPLYAWEMWAAPLDLGTDRFFFVEDCAIKTTHYWNYIDGNWGTRYVVRHNPSITNSWAEVHGNQGDTSRGVRAWEIYGNNYKYDDTYGGYAAVHNIRSGTGVVYDNVVTGGSSQGMMTSLGIDVRRAAAGISLGGNFRDGNEPIPSQGTGTHTGGNSAVGLTDSTKNWAPESLTKGRVLSTAYGIFDPAFWIYNLTSGAYGIISSHTLNTVTATLSGGTRTTWNTGDQYKITGGYWSRDGIGRSTDAYLGNENNWPPQELDPAYFWNNKMNGNLMGVTVRNSTGFWAQEGRDFFANKGPKPGYTPYTYPHPLRSSGFLADDPNAPIVSTASLLRKSPVNPRYFEDASGKIVYLTGSHTWNNLQDFSNWTTFNFNAYLDFLKANNHNLIRLWQIDEPNLNYFNNAGNILPLPYARTGPGLASDGGLKFNLNQLNQEYFDRLRQRVSAAGERGIYVIIMLFDGFWVNGQPTQWQSHFYNPANNINGMSVSLNQVYTLQAPQLLAAQEAYVKKVIDTVNDLDNVLYEIGNEMPSQSKDFQYHMINLIKSYEAGKPKQHPVGMTSFDYTTTEVQKLPGNDWLLLSPADWISPFGGGALYTAYSTNPPAATGAKVIVLDTDHIGAQGDWRYWAWISFTRGHNPIYMDPYDLASRPADTGLRAAMGHTLQYANRINLAAMTPRGDLASTTFALANPGQEYLVYQPTLAVFSVNLLPGDYQFEWFDPLQGIVTSTGIITAPGGNYYFSLPAAYTQGAALYLKVSSAPAQSLIAHWHFDEGSGATARDSAGYTDGLISGAIWAAGKINKALVFDGVDDSVNFGSAAIANFGASDFTISAWVKLPAGRTNAQILNKRSVCDHANFFNLM